MLLMTYLPAMSTVITHNTHIVYGMNLNGVSIFFLHPFG